MASWNQLSRWGDGKIARHASANFPLAPCWRSPMWRSQAEAEGLTLLKADNKTG